MKLLFLIIFILTLFTACSNKANALRYFNNSQQQTIDSIQYTKKADFFYKNQNEVTIIASYLNKIDSEYKSDTTESFLISIQKFDDINLFKDKIEIRLNKALPISFEKIDNSSNVISRISLKNNWATYYFVKFKKINKDEKALDLEFSHKALGQTFITFEK